MKQETTMTRTAIMEKLTTMGVPFKKKDSLQTLKDTLENALNERHYEKYGRPTENAMENETQNCINHIIASMTTKKEKENTMNTENTILATIDTMNTENKEEKKMTKTEQKKAEIAARKAERATKKAEKEQAKAEKKAMNNAKKENISNLLDFITDTWEKNYGPVVVASYEAKTSFVALKMRDTNRQVIKVVFSSTSVRLAFRVDVTEVFEEVKTVNYVLPFQTLIKEDSADVRTRIEKAFELAATTDIKKPSKKSAKKEKKAE